MSTRNRRWLVVLFTKACDSRLSKQQVGYRIDKSFVSIHRGVYTGCLWVIVKLFIRPLSVSLNAENVWLKMRLIIVYASDTVDAHYTIDGIPALISIVKQLG